MTSSFDPSSVVAAAAGTTSAPYHFTIDGFDQLFAATRPDFTPYYAALKAGQEFEPGMTAPADRLLHRGTGGYHARKRG